MHGMHCTEFSLHVGAELCDLCDAHGNAALTLYTHQIQNQNSLNRKHETAGWLLPEPACSAVISAEAQIKDSSIHSCTHAFSTCALLGPDTYSSKLVDVCRNPVLAVQKLPRPDSANQINCAFVSGGLRV